MIQLVKRNWLSLIKGGQKTLGENQTLATWLLIFGFLGISFIAFTPSYIHLFLTDDFKHLSFVQPFIDKPFTVYKAFDPYFLGWYFRPTQLLYFTFFRLFFGTNPAPYYIGLLLLHGFNIVLIYKVSRIWGNGRLGAICAAGLFSVIVTHQGVVGWISAVSILLAATFTLLALYSLRVYLTVPQQKKYLVISLLMAVLAILSREEAVVLFPVILLIWIASSRNRPRKTEILLFIGFGLFTSLYALLIFLRPTWTPHADATLNLSLSSFASIQSITHFSLVIFRSYMSLENMQATIGWLAISLVLSTILLIGLAFLRGNSLLRVGILWTAALLLFLYIVVWLFSGNVPHRYLYLPWLGISLSIGAIVDLIHRKYPEKHIVSSVALVTLIGILIYQTLLSRQQQQAWHDDATITYNNLSQIKELVPEVNEKTHFFAYHMPPVTDYIQPMAAISYNIGLDGRGGEWKRLMKSGFATSNDYLLNYENGLVYNAMPELQAYEETRFIWQENPIAEIIHLDGMSQPLELGTYQLNQIIGSPEQKRFGFFIHPPAPEDGWASLTYTTTVPDNSTLMFGIRKEWGHVAEEDGMMFRVNIVDDTGTEQTVYQASLDSETDGWVEPQIPMNDYWQQTVLLQFQVNANGNLLHDHGYWANPRFVIDSLE